MQKVSVSFDDIHALSFKDKFYQNHSYKLKDFISFEPDMEGLKKAIEGRRNAETINRELLVSVLKDQYKNVKSSPLQQKNIDSLLDNNTFTITTAHQPSILGGPAYYFYKIYSTINLCQQLTTLFPDQRFVPVFINGSEDHDFEEVKSVSLYGKTVEWNTSLKGPVGRFTLGGIDKVIEEASNILGTSAKASQLKGVFLSALKNAKNYNEFVFRWLNEILQDFGVIILNMDEPNLKKAFVPTLKKEIFERKSIDLVCETQDKLATFGFRPQAFAREINVFYMQNGQRERIYFENDQYHINNTDIVFTSTELLSLLENTPENFSPNVVLRPLYQETILPNIAYIGGGGEIAYWLERKTQFEYFNVYFPTLIRRNSITLLNKSIQKNLEKLDIELSFLLKEEHEMVNSYIERASDTDFHLHTEIEHIQTIFESIAKKAEMIDPTLGPFTLGEGHKMLKSVEGIESRLKKSIKQKEETSINQLKNLRNKIFPDNGLQERKESIIPYLVSEDATFQQKLVELCNPLEKEFLFIYL